MYHFPSQSINIIFRLTKNVFFLSRKTCIFVFIEQKNSLCGDKISKYICWFNFIGIQDLKNMDIGGRNRKNDKDKDKKEYGIDFFICFHIYIVSSF